MKNSTLFDDHNDLLLLTYKICTPICVFLNGLAMYLVIFKSSPEMKTYRWHLLHYQIVASALDIFINFLFQPVFFYPLAAGSGHGFLIANLGISTFTCFVIFFNLMGGLALSIVNLFLFRYQCIIRNILTKKQFYFCVALAFAAIIFLSNFFWLLARVDASHWREILEEENPWAMELLEIPNVYYFPHSPQLMAVICIILLGSLLFTSLIFFLVCHIFYALEKESNYLSTRTQKVQRKFFISLIWQVTLPHVLLFTPIVFDCILISNGCPGLQILNNVASMMVSSYGIMAPLCLIYFNEPYREFLFEILKKEIK